jgi:hypothetical protein
MKRILLAALLASAGIAGSPASVIFSDGFSYPDGGIITNSSGIWSPNTGTPNSMLVSNGVLLVSTSRSEDIVSVLTGGPYKTNESVAALFTCFKLTFTGLPGVPGTYLHHLSGEQLTLHRGRLWASRTNLTTGAVAADGNFYLGIGNITPSTTVSVGPANGQIQTELTTNVTYTVVTRLEIASGRATLWVDPTSESDPSVTADDYVDPTNIVNIKYVAFRQASGEGTMAIDDLKVGTAFSDVAGANTAPTISAIPTQSSPASGVVGPLGFTVDDAETAAAALEVTGTSSNPQLIQDQGIMLGGSGANRTVTLTPIAGQQGQAVITLNVSDGVNTSFTTFLAKIGAPTISSIPPQIALTNTTVPTLAFTVNDPEGDALTLRATSSNSRVLPADGIVFGGAGPDRTVTLNPVAGEVGVSTITVAVDDGFNTNSSVFTLTMKPAFGLLFKEDFAYTEFVPNEGNALYLATGSPWTSVSGTYFQVQVTNGLGYLSYTNSEDVGAALTGAPYFSSNAVVFYVGCTVNCSVLPSRNGNYFLHLKQSDTDTLSFRAKIFASTANAGDGMFRFGVANVANSPVSFPMDLNLDTTYAVVMRYNSGTGDTVLWVNPISEASAFAAAADTPSTGTVGGVGLREDTGIGNIAIGSLKIGTSFSDVFIPTTPAAEPLQFTFADGQLILTWTNPAFSLEESTSAEDGFKKVEGAKSPYPTSAANGTKFYRLVYP